MTLEPYSPERLDQLSLRFLDICLGLRQMARRSREEQLEAFALHDKKPLEWLARLDDWLGRAEAEFDLAVAKNRGARKAAEAAGRKLQPKVSEAN